MQTDSLLFRLYLECLFLLFSSFHVHVPPPASLTVSPSFGFLFHPSCSKQVPFGPLAFMPGKLVHTNEVTALLGDNWFAKCSTKQAQKIVDHRMKCESPLERIALVLSLKQTVLFTVNVSARHCSSSSSRGGHRVIRLKNHLSDTTYPQLDFWRTF